MDPEKHVEPEKAPRGGRPVATKVLRAGQYVWSTLSLVLIACAIDRNILVPGVSAEEIVSCTATTVAIVVLLFHFLKPSSKVVVTSIDTVVAAFLFASFVYGAVQAGQRQGDCVGPDKLGVWDNLRGCNRLKAATAFSAINFLFFSASALVAALS